MEIKRIKPPKYKVGIYILNEYELRCLMTEVCDGEKPQGLIVTDEKGRKATILPDGRLSENLFGLDICGNYTIHLIREDRLRNIYLMVENDIVTYSDFYKKNKNTGNISVSEFQTIRHLRVGDSFFVDGGTIEVQRIDMNQRNNL